VLSGAGHAAVAELVGWSFDPAIGNAFSHAAYTLHDDVFRALGEDFRVGEILTSEMPITQLGEQFNRALTFYDRFLEQIAIQRTNYRENRVVPGRIARPEPVHGIR
jgi:hypothetical protein